MYIQTILNGKNEKIKSMVTDNNGSLRVDFLSKIDEAYSLPENANYLSDFNNKYSKKTKSLYNPNLKENTKFVGGCVECRSFIDYVVRACNNYGCVAEEFVTTVESSNCNQFVLPTTSQITTPLKLGVSTKQIASNGTQVNNCVTAPMTRINTAIEIRLEALCNCTGVDAMAQAIEFLMQTIKLTFDKAILYGDTTLPKVSGVYPAFTNFDSIDQFLTTAQKTTSTGIIETYTKITDAVAKILATTNCSRESIQVLMSPTVAAKLLGATDNNDRPIISEVTNKDGCEVRLGCQKLIECPSVETTVSTTGEITTDIFVGIKDHYVFGKYLFPEIQPFNSQTSYDIEIPMIYFVGSKLVFAQSFQKITATI